jgi:hypothetical protein
MNIWVKSILIGAVVTILTYLWLYKKPPETYTGHYIIRVKQQEDAIVEDKRTIERVADNLETKMARANIKAEIKILNDQLIDLTISKLKYPSSIPQFITSKIELEFREMYILADLAPALGKVDTLLGYAKQDPTLAKDIIPEDTGSLATFTEGYTPAPEKTRKSILNFIQFAQAYENSNKKTILPPYIGKVLLKDTAFVDSIFNRKEILEVFPGDLKFLYGPLYLDEKNKKSSEYLDLFAVRSMQDIPAPINNNSIMNARVDNDYKGEPVISLEFNIVAAKKWEQMTTDNVGRPIGIIINNRVISAPNVNGRISGGTASISGGYTKQDATYIVDQILAGSIPASITIVKQEVNRENEPFLAGNLALYLILFLVTGLVSYLIFNFLDKNKHRHSTESGLRGDPIP